MAGLLTSELESLAIEKEWGDAIGVTAWFLRPAPMADLRTAVTPLIQGRRLSVIENTLYAVDEAEPIASVRVTFAHKRPIDIQLSREATQHHDPLTFPARDAKLAAGKTWFMNAMEMRVAPDVAWFRLTHQITPHAGTLAMVLGPADWTHGLARPVRNVAADPNPNLTVHLFRAPLGDWIGVQAHTRWQPERGLGMGRGTLFDTSGEIGCVSMDVVLLPMKGA